MTITSWTRPVNAVLFDLDGTLMHTAPDITAAVNQMLVSRKLPILPEALVTNLIGRGSPTLIERVFHVLDVHVTPGERLDALQVFQECYEHIVGSRARPFPGVADALERLRDMDLKLAVVTNKYHRFAIKLLRQFHMASMFDLVVGGDTLEVRKPNPLPILHACDSLDVPVSQSLYIGDSPIDVEAAKSAGVPVFCVPYGYREGQPVESLAADGFIETLADIPYLITGKRHAPNTRATA
ncbi:MAG TPA: phosphoglycolate phosphatase [Noviherbaspirillum sp.]